MAFPCTQAFPLMQLSRLGFVFSWKGLSAYEYCFLKGKKLYQITTTIENIGLIPILYLEISEDLDSCVSGDTPSARALRNKNCKPLCLYTSINEQPLSYYTERVLVNTGSSISMGPYEQEDSNDKQ